MQTFKKPLSYEEECHYLKMLKEGDSFARNVLIESNLRLVAHIVKKYCSSYHETEDLISIGTIGLIKAIDSYDISKGSKLCAYASRCIENELLMKFRQERKVSREVSLFEPIGTDREGNEINLMDIIRSDDDDIASNLIYMEELAKLDTLVSQVLSKREKHIISLRYLDKSMTQREVAELLGISRSYVSRIEKRALSKLHNALK